MTNTILPYTVKPIRRNGQNHLSNLTFHSAHPIRLKILPEARVQVFSKHRPFCLRTEPVLGHRGLYGPANMTTEDVKFKLIAILSADVKEYSRLMGQDEVGTILPSSEGEFLSFHGNMYFSGKGTNRD